MLYSSFSLGPCLPIGGGEPGLGCQMLKFRVKGQLGSDLCIITQILSALPTAPPPLTAHRWDRVLIKCPFLSQNSNFHTILLTRLIPYSDHKKSVRNCSFSPVFKCLKHFACQVLTLLDNEKFKKVALFIANQQQATFCCKLFNKNHVST